MRTKNLFIILAISACLSIACSKIDNPNPNPYPTPTKDEAPEMYVPYETLYVQVPAGCKSVVFVGSNKVATCYRSGNVLIPKTATTKADAELPYSIVTVETSESGLDSENTLEMVVAYEDTKDGDHDYNDLVFQARLDIRNGADGTNKTDIEITPVALGATKTLALGVVLSAADGTVIKDELITDDCNMFLFEGDCVNGNFVNTTGSRKHYNPVKITLNSVSDKAVTGISWYLISDVERLYAATSFQACLDDAEWPQGLVLMNLNDNIYSFEKDGETYSCGNDFWLYPREGVSIDRVYPGFNESFLAKGDFSVLATPAEGSLFYNAILDNDLTVNSNDCLYTLYVTSRNSGDESATDANAVDFGLSVKWADRNVGAAAIEDCGLFFEWGNTVGYLCEGEECDHTFTATYATVLQQTILGTVDPESEAAKSVPGALLMDSFTSGDANHDGARANMGGNWRMPTTAEIQELYNNTLQRQEVMNGVNGIKFVLVNKNGSMWDQSRWTIYEDKWLFFPCAGVIDFNVSKARGSFGYYWSCDIPRYGETLSIYNGTTLGVNFEGGNGFQSSYSRSSAMSIRAVCD